ncbi:MAG TPA: formimidoylglutamate deiminase [Thermoanaerobaculia bacterium]|nr:formimidoylglutamate deiminase [Thermoanaerobaculia bacterium]
MAEDITAEAETPGAAATAGMAGEVVEADWTWTGERFEAGWQLRLDREGRIAEAGRLGLPATQRLPRRALLPGMVSAHSHAFQRGLRGRGESFPEGAGSFWTWREAMYELVGRLGAGELERLCLQTFRELRAAGVTAVGEFHYLHHEGAGRDYALDARVLAAAAAAGIRIVLLNTYYRTGGLGQPLEGAQRRFESPSPGPFWEQMDRLAGQLAGLEQSLGAAVHSLRAATPGELAEIYGEARRRGLVVHLHLEEQRREVDEALAFYGRRPLEHLLAVLPSAAGLTAVHCTHSAPQDLERFLAAGGAVCVCPLTEANLGDGIPDLSLLAPRFGERLCLGTDSNARISLLEEMRWLEYGQRLRREARGALRDAAGRVAAQLLQAATAGGARALGLPCGRLAPGCWADLIALDLDLPSLAGWEPDTLLESLIFGAGDEAIAATAVAGIWQQHR